MTVLTRTEKRRDVVLRGGSVGRADTESPVGLYLRGGEGNRGEGGGGGGGSGSEDVFQGLSSCLTGYRPGRWHGWSTVYRRNLGMIHWLAGVYRARIGVDETASRKTQLVFLFLVLFGRRLHDMYFLPPAPAAAGTFAESPSSGTT